MGACTVSIDTTTSHQLDHLLMFSGTLHFSSSYAIGGDTLTAAQLGLGYIHDIYLDMGTVVPQPTLTTPGQSSITVKAFVSGETPGSLLQEAKAGSNLTTVGYRFHAWGY